MELYVFLHNMILIIILHKKVLNKKYQKINSLWDILHFILVHFGLKYK